MERNSTAHYVFSLGIARFLGCASWILQPNTLAFVFSQLGSFKLWGVASLLSELIQTFVLADFWCVDSAREDAPRGKNVSTDTMIGPPPPSPPPPPRLPSYYYIRSMAEGSGLVRFHNTI